MEIRRETLASVNTMMKNKEDRGSHFSRSLHQEKHERIARNSLYDLFVFYEALEKEIARIGETPAKLTPTEAEVLERMLAVQEHYLNAMKGFKELGAELQQHALVRFSDSVLDLMKIMHKHKRH